MIFLHPEFFFWMLVPVAVLFYFWQTQKSSTLPWFTESVLTRLRAPDVTMGLRGRNTLFLIAAILMISAMAQPVILENEAEVEDKVEILVAMDFSKKPILLFENEKLSVIDLINRLRGENIALVGYDGTHVYRVAPYSTDTDMLISLVDGLSIDIMRTSHSNSHLVKRVQSRGMTIVIGDPNPEKNTQLSNVIEKLEKLKKSQRLYAHVPLFYYPLGLAMLLIWIALSSMSKRRSVPISFLVVFLSLNSIPSHAGVLDFQELRAGFEAYKKGDFIQSAQHFQYYQKNHDSAEIRYNLGNAWYKAKEYKKASYWYGRVYTTKRSLAQSAAYNLILAQQHTNATSYALVEPKQTGNIGEEKLKSSRISSMKKERISTRIYRIF
ncbi:MAG: hypothetical protein PHO27_03585 [Sulfuricurvum sp.]|nr:hypothetical protein [Sulfuricurvum sp.]